MFFRKKFAGLWAASISARYTIRKWDVLVSLRPPLRPPRHVGTWPSSAIVPVTPSIGLALSAPDTLTQHDDRWTFRGRRHRPAHGHDLQAVYGTIAIAAA